MHSSTSASKSRRDVSRIDRFTVLLLCTILSVLAAAEAISITGFDKISRAQRRQISQRQLLVGVRDDQGTEPRHIAVIGNSLLLEGLDTSLLAGETGPRAVPVPYFVLATEYYDWFYGLRRIFAEGARPRYVLLGLSPNQLVTPSTPGSYSSRYLFQKSDLFDVIHETRMDDTSASDFLLSHFSAYYSTRDTTRGYILGRLFPGLVEMLHNQVAAVRDPELAASVVRPVSRERLWALNDLCRKNGAIFMLVIPPTYQKGADSIASIGKDLGITVLVPIPNESFDASFYSDGFHLNQKGAQIFTKALAASLIDRLQK